MKTWNQFWTRQTFFLSGSSLYFLDSIFVRSRLLISGWILAYLARFSMKKRKYGVRGFLGKSGWVCGNGSEVIGQRIHLVPVSKHWFTSSHLQFLSFVRVLYKLDGVDDDFCHGSVLTNLKNRNVTGRTVQHQRYMIRTVFSWKVLHWVQTTSAFLIY